MPLKKWCQLRLRRVAGTTRLRPPCPQPIRPCSGYAPARSDARDELTSPAAVDFSGYDGLRTGAEAEPLVLATDPSPPSPHLTIFSLLNRDL